MTRNVFLVIRAKKGILEFVRIKTLMLCPGNADILVGCQQDAGVPRETAQRGGLLMTAAEQQHLHTLVKRLRPLPPMEKLYENYHARCCAGSAGSPRRASDP